MQMFGLVKIYSKIKILRNLIMLTAIETTGTIGANRRLLLDEDLPENILAKMRVIVLFAEDDLSEKN